MNEKPIIQYYYRGGVERGPRYDWHNGYSENSAEGHETQPWMTYRECQQDAKVKGSRAVFVNANGKPIDIDSVHEGPGSSAGTEREYNPAIGCWTPILPQGQQSTPSQPT